MRHWLDNMIVSPWLTLTRESDASSILLDFRRFGGNDFGQGIIEEWAVRSLVRVDNAESPGDSIDCTSL